MSMEVSTIRFEPEEKKWIEAFAKLNGMSFSAQIRQWALSQLEDEMDARDLAEAIANTDPNDKGIPFDEIKTRYGLD